MKPGILMGAVALGLLSGPAGAEWLSNVSTNGVNIAYWLLTPGTCELQKTTTEPSQDVLDALLRGTDSQCVSGGSSGPGGNIELGDVDELVWEQTSTLSGEICQGSVQLSSLTYNDWLTVMPSGERLADQYLADAIQANCGVRPPVNATFQGFVNQCFLGGDCLGNPVSPPPAQRASDPNVAYVRSNSSGSISIGLAGNLDSSDLLPPAFNCALVGGQQQGPLQASEVVKFQVQGGPAPQYFYSFDASPSGITADDATGSYDATYPITVPAPAPLVCRRASSIPAVPAAGLLITLAGLGFAGIHALRRRSGKVKAARR